MIVAVSVFAPEAAEDDPRPTSTNNGPHGAKAAYLTLKELGMQTSRWDGSLEALQRSLTDAQARQTTWILAAPDYDPTKTQELAGEIKKFLERGGRVLVTGASGAPLLPRGEAKPAGLLHADTCHTIPEGPGALAAAGSVEMDESSQWANDGPQYRVEQRCGAAAVVVTYVVTGASGVKGEAIWWSSARPMENAELKHDADLRLLLASVGSGRRVVFDESVHGAPKTLWDEANGLPIGWIALQAALLFALIVLSFGRRRAPVRARTLLPRSSPVEFAVSMGDLYERAAASSAATDAAKRRLLRVLALEAGLAQSTLDAGADAIEEALRERFGGDWKRIGEHLNEASRARHERIAMHSALALVRAMHEDAERVRAQLERRTTEVAV
jgi:hypothetical protein